MRVINQHITASDGSVHVLAFHKSTRTTRPQSVYEQQLRPYHRVRFLPIQLLSVFGSPDFAAAIDDYVLSEERWRTFVMPKDKEDPLLLPRDHFHAQKAYRTIWDEAAVCGADDQRLTLLQKTVIAFRRQLRRTIDWQVGYIDASDRVFVYNGALHGIPEEPIERWKSNYKMPPGFHYDVQGMDDNMVMYFADGAAQRRVVGHVNIYPHGQMR
jgi:hypothetical protein